MLFLCSWAGRLVITLLSGCTLKQFCIVCGKIVGGQRLKLCWRSSKSLQKAFPLHSNMGECMLYNVIVRTTVCTCVGDYIASVRCVKEIWQTNLCFNLPFRILLLTLKYVPLKYVLLQRRLGVSFCVFEHHPEVSCSFH